MGYVNLYSRLFLSFFRSLLTLGVYKQRMTDSMCGLCIFPDKLCVCACRLFSSPPCLSPAPVQTCLPRARPWRVRCPVSKPSASGREQSFHKSEEKNSKDGRQCNGGKHKNSSTVYKKGNHSKKRI